MALLNPGAGEMCDRLTILSLKILAGQEAEKSVSHFVNERNGLLTKLKGRELNGAWFESVLQLGAVNAALWARTDEQRTYLAGISNWQAAAECGCAIMRLNDERARLVRQINELSGDLPKDAGQEKL